MEEYPRSVRAYAVVNDSITSRLLPNDKAGSKVDDRSSFAWSI
jgi:hypothetical protein